MSAKPLEAVIVGAGHRSVLYASYAEKAPQDLRVVGVVEPWDERRERAAERFGIPPEHRFKSVEQLLAQPRLGNVAFNGTMDPLHVKTTLPLLDAGYDILLEKPIAPTAEGLLRIGEAARVSGRMVVVCHVLRYAPFYRELRQRVIDGVVGDLVNIQTTEHVSYHHLAAAFLRGKWASTKQCGSSMLLAKCCHDLDLVAWMKSGVRPVRVSSFGGIYQFRPDKAPEGAGTRCLVDCSIEPDCVYSAKKHYIDNNWWHYYAWECLEHLDNPTVDDKIESLRTENPFGRCVWHCDNDVVDHQSVAVEFEDGSTATHNLVGASSKASRSIHILGTRGELYGCLEDSRFTIYRPDLHPEKEYREEVVDVSIPDSATGEDGHGGGDLRLVEDFVNVLQGKPPSISTTTIDDSINGHLIVYCADQAMQEGRVVDIPDTR
jgi:predicted dehydrogenase